MGSFGLYRESRKADKPILNRSKVASAVSEARITTASFFPRRFSLLDSILQLGRLREQKLKSVRLGRAEQDLPDATAVRGCGEDVQRHVHFQFDPLPLGKSP